MDSNKYHYLNDEINKWALAIKLHTNCLETYFNTQTDTFTKISEEQLNDPNNDRICLRELSNLRSLAPSIGYKEILGRFLDPEWKYDKLTNDFGLRDYDAEAERGDNY